MELNFQYEDNNKERRHSLIEHLGKFPELDKHVIEAMGIIPRELFVSESFLSRAYEDTALPIDCRQTISQPYTVAFMTTELKICKNDKILEIGTGSGYQACLLYILGARVFTIERIPELHNKATELFRQAGVRINTRIGDGSLGWSEFAPYKGIIITASAPYVPRILLNQLEIGGRMVIPVGDKESQSMYIITRVSEDKFEERKKDRFKFVPLIGKEGWKESE